MAPPPVASMWSETIKEHAELVQPSSQDVALAILQGACERAHQRNLLSTLDGETSAKDRSALQVAICIDVRSEVFRRALESTSPHIETIGFAGFFSLLLAHKSHGSDVVENHLPVLLNAAIETTSHADPAVEEDTRINARAARACGRFQQAAVSSFAFVEAAGPLYAGKLLKDALGLAEKAPR